MAHYRCVGCVPPTRHTQHRTPEGGLYYEELVGEEGFRGSSALLYHGNIPSAVTGVGTWDPDAALTPNAPLLPRHFRLHDLVEPEASGVDAVTGRRVVLGNPEVRVGYVAAGAVSPLYRNAIGDECVFVESGRGTVETIYGPLDVRPGDYVLLPRGTTHRWVPHHGERLDLYCIEASGHIAPPERYLSATGQFLEHAPYCERDLHGPGAVAVVEDSDVEVYVKHGDGAGGVAGTVYTYARHPFDVVGWDGGLYPYTFNVADFQPLTGRVHQPPPAHQVFAGPGFVVCNFVPRKVDYHPLSIPAPYYHANVDCDEVMFYVDGDYRARRGSGIARGSVSLHPTGHTHGPQPGAYENSPGTVQVDELAVMIDTFRPLGLGEAGRATDDGVYWSTWGARGPVG